MGLCETRLRLCANFQAFGTPYTGRTSGASRFADLPIPHPCKLANISTPKRHYWASHYLELAAGGEAPRRKISSLAASFALLLHSKSARLFWLSPTTVPYSAPAAKQVKQEECLYQTWSCSMEPMLQLTKGVSTPRPCYVPERIGTAPATSLPMQRRNNYLPVAIAGCGLASIFEHSWSTTVAWFETR